MGRRLFGGPQGRGHESAEGHTLRRPHLAARRAGPGPGLRPPHRSGRDHDGDVDVHRKESDHRRVPHSPLLLRLRSHLRRGADRHPIPHAEPPRVAAVLFGGGLGLCVDEMGYFLGGQVNYFDRTTYFIATSIILVLLAALSFRSFREATRDDLRWLVGRRPRGIAILAVLQILASPALLVGGLVLVVAAGLPP